MRILVVSGGGIAAERPVQWMIEAGYEVCLVGDGDFYHNDHPANYSFFPSQWHMAMTANPELPTDENQMAIEMAPRLREIADEFQPDNAIPSGAIVLNPSLQCITKSNFSCLSCLDMP